MNAMRTAVCLAVLLAGSHIGHAQEYKIAMGDGMLDFVEISSLRVEGYDGNEVVIKTQRPYRTPERAKGLKLINASGLSDNTNIGLSVDKKTAGVVKVYQLSKNSDVRYVVMVPKKVKLRYVSNSNQSDDFIAEKIKGELEIKTMHNDVRLMEVSGPLSVSSVHGDVDVVFAQVAEGMPSSITTAHGDLDVSIPPAAKMSVKVKSSHGEVYSNLDLKMETTKDGLQQYGGGQVVGTFNGGGTDLNIKSSHGDVYLRKR